MRDDDTVRAVIERRAAQRHRNRTVLTFCAMAVVVVAHPPTGKAALAYIWSLGWSPDSSTLGFIEEYAHIGGTETSVSVQAIALQLPAPGQAGPGTVRTLYDCPVKPYDTAAVLWSPDGTRVAIRAPGGILELSVADSRVLARHARIEGSLIWPARRP